MTKPGIQQEAIGSFGRSAVGEEPIRCFPEGAAMPLICPICLRNEAREQLLDETGACSLCGVRYHSRRGIPILLANDFEREALTSGESPGDPRSRFYPESSDYWL